MHVSWCYNSKLSLNGDEVVFDSISECFQKEMDDKNGGAIPKATYSNIENTPELTFTFSGVNSFTNYITGDVVGKLNEAHCRELRSSSSNRLAGRVYLDPSQLAPTPRSEL